MTVRVSLTVEPGPGSERGEETAAAVATLKTEHENTIHGSKQLPPLSTSARCLRCMHRMPHYYPHYDNSVSVSVVSPGDQRLVAEIDWLWRASGRVQQSGFPGLGGG